MTTGCFENIDIVFSRKLLGLNADVAASLALSYLFAACRQGHHCVSLKETTIFPMLQGSFDGKQIKKGFLELPQDIVQEVSDHLNLKPIVKCRDHFYLQKYFLLEEKILCNLRRLLNGSLNLIFNQNLIENHLDVYAAKLNNDQKKAVMQSLSSPISLLTGGPGTGKTYTVKYLLKTYLSLCREVQVSPRVLIAAPTGKAAATLREKLDGLAQHQIEILTLHRALKIQRQQDLKKPRVLLHDLIVVDECSMVDLHLWTALFSAIAVGSRVILMGDPYQLPPVETGMIFQELFQALPSSSLNICMRTEAKQLVDIASAVKTGNMDLVQGYLEETSSELSIYEFENEVDILQLAPWQKVDYFVDLKKRCILSPKLEGPWGVNTLNKQLYALHDKSCSRESYKMVPIIITKTDYAHQHYNRATGFLVEHKDVNVLDYAIFESKGDKQFDKSQLPPYQEAYALSVHKSQGSEYEEVFLFLPEGSQVFGREIIYTAITRAKCCVTIFAKKNVLQQCLFIDGKKHSALSERLIEL
ncbi:MAG: AAA family ATPase [Chlamydiota bacterium]